MPRRELSYMTIYLLSSSSTNMYRNENKRLRYLVKKQSLAAPRIPRTLRRETGPSGGSIDYFLQRVQIVSSQRALIFAQVTFFLFVGVR